MEVKTKICRSVADLLKEVADLPDIIDTSYEDIITYAILYHIEQAKISVGTLKRSID